MRKITLKALFANAPTFRSHEGLIGAKYHIKDPNHPDAPGLWFAHQNQTLEIATQKSTLYNTKDRDTARADYDFVMVNVQAGDAVIDYHLYFHGSRQGWNGDYGDRSKNEPFPMYKYERQNGALIQFHIPQDIFQATYEWDDVGKFYCTKPYQKKFVSENLMVVLTDGSVEQVPADCEVSFNGQRLIVERPSVMHGGDMRLICGQPLSFYMDELRQFQKSTPMDDTGLGLSMRMRSGQKPPNPYAALRAVYNTAANALNTSVLKLSRDQQSELDNHIGDIEARYAYFESHPVAFE